MNSDGRTDKQLYEEAVARILELLATNDIKMGERPRVERTSNPLTFSFKYEDGFDARVRARRSIYLDKYRNQMTITKRDELHRIRSGRWCDLMVYAFFDEDQHPLRDPMVYHILDINYLCANSGLLEDREKVKDKGTFLAVYIDRMPKRFVRASSLIIPRASFRERVITLEKV